MSERQETNQQRFWKWTAADFMTVIIFALAGIFAFEDAKSDIRNTNTTIDGLHALGTERREVMQRQIDGEQLQLDNQRALIADMHDTIIEIRDDVKDLKQHAGLARNDAPDPRLSIQPTIIK